MKAASLKKKLIINARFVFLQHKRQIEWFQSELGLKEPFFHNTESLISGVLFYEKFSNFYREIFDGNFSYQCKSIFVRLLLRGIDLGSFKKTILTNLR